MATPGWEIELMGDGTADVRRNGRAAAYDLDLEEALDWVRRAEPGGTEVTIIELDGYRTRRRV